MKCGTASRLPSAGKHQTRETTRRHRSTPCRAFHMASVCLLPTCRAPSDRLLQSPPRSASSKKSPRRFPIAEFFVPHFFRVALPEHVKGTAEAFCTPTCVGGPCLPVVKPAATVVDRCRHDNSFINTVKWPKRLVQHFPFRSSEARTRDRMLRHAFQGCTTSSALYRASMEKR